MAERKVSVGLIQMSCTADKQANIDKAVSRIREAAGQGAQVICLQELFSSHYFCYEENYDFFELAETVPGPTTILFRDLAKELGVVLVASLFEKRTEGIYHNTTAVIDADGTYLGKYRKNHIPHTGGFWEKFFFKPGNLGYPVFQTKYARVGVYICYDRHFPDGARCLGLNGAEIVYNPSATTAGQSQYLWKLEQPAHAVANGYFMGCINRVGTEAPWNLGQFYGSSYFVDPRGQIFAAASEDKDELLVSEFDLDLIDEVRSKWQFFRDRRPETYGKIIEP